MMMVDTVSKAQEYSPKLVSCNMTTYILRYTMNLQRTGYALSNLGEMNQFFHILGMTCRILYLRVGSTNCNYIFWLCIPFSLSYIWTHLGYTIILFGRWKEIKRHQKDVV